MLDPKEILTSLADRFSTTGKIQTVFGEPIEAHGKTIITVARVTYGLGAGGGAKINSGARMQLAGQAEVVASASILSARRHRSDGRRHAIHSLF
jgi:uncharacterized spore protein YtfJ